MTTKALCAVLLALSAVACPTTLYAATSATEQAADFSAHDADFAKWMEEAHVPGLVWGVVKDGRLVHLKAMGVQELRTRSPVRAISP